MLFSRKDLFKIIIPLIAQQLLNADVNFDGEVDQSDLTKLFSFVLGEIESL